MYKIRRNTAILQPANGRMVTRNGRMQKGVIVDNTGNGDKYCQLLGQPGQWSAVEHIDMLGDALPALLLFMQIPQTIPAHCTMPFFINDTLATFTVAENDTRPIVRFCGWNTMMERAAWEIAAYAQANIEDWKPAAELLLSKKLTTIANVPGFVAPRIVATIINEACFGLADQLCTEADMDLAMQLGTNYPKGPVQWMKEIGPQNIHALLSALALQDSRYMPHPLLNR
ncbi:MAG TPA: 3-hydroxyacyl-CoA dehydrogenase family protein [Phnomibacter sp.]|nr:3-hydroxyacyl-CoA dehydrogenase family protein [Phnomibacter sp.]